MTGRDIVRSLAPALVASLSRTLPENLPDRDLSVALVRDCDARLVALADGHNGDFPASVTSLSRADGSALEVRLHGPQTETAILWIHGGGMFLGSARADDPICAMIAQDLGVTVAAVDYRLAPEHRHPEPIADCAAALRWLQEMGHSVVVAGMSAGGGLALGLALRERDGGRTGILAVHAYYPMVDDRESTSKRDLRHAPVWNARLDRLAWDAYLGAASADGYAAPARARDLSGLPPTVIETGEYDLFRSEDEALAARLARAGVLVTLKVHPHGLHAGELLVPEAPWARQIWAARFDEMRSRLVYRERSQ